ncbi:hypothetical protein I551_7746 [Mycobacterium ulcerans str. Harvey]|uniref:Uncharacterized protein n=1 Tax=Mycobacterium ulcerans str. Harvey TaxID=1299332 RepID=A0ABP3A2J8_MYCUL|nr:hypothetical protein I551_7746 [Mycobacterium ulcerans str. Harvey]
MQQVLPHRQDDRRAIHVQAAGNLIELNPDVILQLQTDAGRHGTRD